MDAERSADRKSQVGSGDRTERIRTYNFPQGRMTDHRINLTLYKLDQVIAGDLDEIIDALTDDPNWREYSYRYYGTEIDTDGARLELILPALAETGRSLGWRS